MMKRPYREIVGNCREISELGLDVLPLRSLGQYIKASRSEICPHSRLTSNI